MQELREARVDLGREISAVRVDVLAEQRHLADTLTGERAHLGEDLTGPAAHLATPDVRDDAIRAHGVAAHRHLHPRLHPALAKRGQLGREPALLGGAESVPRDPDAARAEPVAEMSDRAGAEREVDERVELEDALPLRLGIAAADGDDDIGAAALECRGVAEVRCEARVGLFADRARVEDDHVGLLLHRGLAEAEVLEEPFDALGVVRVHLAAERGDVVAPHAAPVYGRSFLWIRSHAIATDG